MPKDKDTPHPRGPRSTAKVARKTVVRLCEVGRAIVELAASALLTYWMHRLAWPPDVRLQE